MASPQPDTTRKVVKHTRTTPITDSLLTLLFDDWQSPPEFPDFPEETSWWQLDPYLYRLSVGMWGDLETFYPLGLAPSYLSRSDNLVGDQSFANPVPLPGSEEFIRTDLADAYYFLTPGLTGIYSPFGRALSIRQRRQLSESDTARAKVYVTRGRGAFSNTTFTFQNHFGKIGNINADGTFQKTNGLVIGSNSKLNRLRVIVEPELGTNLHTSVLYSLNRLQGGRVFFPDNYFYSGFNTDNLANLSLSASYYPSDNSSYSAQLNYKNDDQKFDNGRLRTAQRFRLLEGSAQAQHSLGTQVLTLGGNLRFLHFRHDPGSSNTLYYNLYGSNLWTLSGRFHVFAHGALRGSEDLKPALAVSGLVNFNVFDRLSLSGVVSRNAVVPQPEMQYLDPIAASFDGDTLIDYRLVGDKDLEAGVVESVEGILAWNSDRLKAQIRGGVSHLNNVAAWQVNYDSLANGTFQPVPLDRNLFFATFQSSISLTSRLHLDAAFGRQRVKQGGTDDTYGPENTGSVVGWYKYFVKKYQVDITVGAGGRFRSDCNPYFVGGGDQAVFITDSYLSFDLKKFHLFFNFTNVFDLYYTLNGLQQPGRSMWWGFNWAFEN